MIPVFGGHIGHWNNLHLVNFSIHMEYICEYIWHSICIQWKRHYSQTMHFHKCTKWEIQDRAAYSVAFRPALNLWILVLLCEFSVETLGEKSEHLSANARFSLRQHAKVATNNSENPNCYVVCQVLYLAFAFFASLFLEDLLTIWRVTLIVVVSFIGLYFLAEYFMLLFQIKASG